LIEFDFDEEEGQGRGPTFEFYQLMSQSLMELNIWRTTDNHDLFPMPFIEFPDADRLKAIFRLIGVLVGRCILDNRIFPLPISSVFWKLVL